MKNAWLLGSDNGLQYQDKGTILENKMEVNTRPLGVTGEGEENKTKQTKTQRLRKS